MGAGELLTQVAVLGLEFGDAAVSKVVSVFPGLFAGCGG